MNTVNQIQASWSNYDKAVAECHLANYGVIYLDEFNCPIDDEAELDYIELNKSEE